jgi:uncharacterized protein YndB with AHSA1/START domain
MDVEGQVTVRRPIDQVFQGFADLERSGEYSAPVIERTKLTDGPMGVGTRFHALDRWPGRHVEFTVEITKFEPNRLVAASWSDPMPGGWEARFESVEGGARVIFQAKMSPKGIMGLLAPVMKPWARRQTREFLSRFKEWSEAQGTAEL